MKELILLFIGLFFIVKAADVLVTASSVSLSVDYASL